MASLKDQLNNLCQEIINEGTRVSSSEHEEFNAMRKCVETWLNEDKNEEQLAENLDIEFGLGSSKYLPQLMREIQGLDESLQLDEDYDDRLSAILNIIREKYPSVERKDIEFITKSAAQDINAVELRSPGLFEELVDDVRKALAAEGRIKRAGARNKEAVETLVNDLSIAIAHYAGEFFPDGDPIDALIPWMKNRGIPEVSFGKMLNKAAEKLGAKSYSDYLADVYDSFTADNPGVMGLDPNQNPWRESVEEKAPKGWEGTVKAMKRHPDKIDNPYALAHWMKRKGRTPHYSEGMEEGYTSRELTDYDNEWLSREIPGLEGPFRHQGNGKYYYYDPKEGSWYDPTSDFYMDKDFQLESIEEIQEIENVADPHGGSMISPYDNEPDDAELDKAQQIVQDQALEILNYDYSDVLQEYNLEEIDGLASDIANDAIVSSKGAFDDPEIVYAVDVDQVKDFVAAAIRRRIGVTEDRDYFMQETLRRIQNLAGIKK